MDKKHTPRISVFFWNAGITPLQYSTPSNEAIDNAVSVIEHIKKSKDSYVIIMCETNSASIDMLEKKTKLKATKMTAKITKTSSFDMCAITSNDISIDEDQISFIKGSNNSIMQDHLDSKKDNISTSGRSMKVGVHFKIKKNAEKSIDVIASHWSSKLYGYSQSNRKESIEKIKPVIRKTIRTSETGVIVMGDFNEDPHFINSWLMGYSNKHYAIQDKYRLYNLSSSFSAPHKPYKRTEKMHFNGTYLDRSSSNRCNQPESCNVLDQALVSSYFMTEKEWSLSESTSGIFMNECILKMLYNGDIDHLPILVEIEK